MLCLEAADTTMCVCDALINLENFMMKCDAFAEKCQKYLGRSDIFYRTL